jgi:hypothetical protein
LAAVCTCAGVLRFDIQQLEQLIVAAERFLPAWSVNLHVTLFQLVPELSLNFARHPFPIILKMTMINLGACKKNTTSTSKGATTV